MPPKSRTTVKRTYVRKATIPRAPRLKTRVIRRRCKLPQIQSVTSTGLAFGSYSFSLSNLPNYTDFTSLYDQYRINKVMLMFIPQSTMLQPASPSSQSIFHYAIDHTDVTAPTAETDVLQYDSVKTVQAYKPFSVSLVPVCAQTVWQGISANGYAPAKPKSWVDCKSYGVQHYGLKCVWLNNYTATQYIDVYCTYWVELREPN